MAKQQWGLIPFFIPHLGCPQICIFCNQHRIAKEEGVDGRIQQLVADTMIPSALPSPETIRNTIVDYVGKKRQDKYWEVAFYGGSFSAIPRTWQEYVLKPAYEALQEGLIDGIRCSTRPDALGQEEIDFLRSYGLTTIEIGVQSMDDEILLTAKRGHTAADVRAAVGRLKAAGLTVGLQILPGLPGETWESLVKTAVAISSLEPDFVRIYPVLVIDNTDLADMYRAGQYKALSLDEAIQYSALLKGWFQDHGIEVIRTGLQATEKLNRGDSLVAGPYHPSFGEMVDNQDWRNRIESLLEDYIEAFGVDRLPSSKESIEISYPVSMASKVKGLKKRNEAYFASTYSHFSWRWKTGAKSPRIRIGKLEFVL